MDEGTWLASQLRQLSCYFADHPQLSQGLSFIEADCCHALWNDICSVTPHAGI